MREVERARFVDAKPDELDRVLSPRVLLEGEGTFTVVDTDAIENGQRVTARGGGVEAVFVFEQRADGYDYRQGGDRGPFESMATTLTYAARDHGSDVTVHSSVSLGLPLAPVTDRIAAWKRRGELDRLLDAVEAAV